MKAYKVSFSKESNDMPWPWRSQDYEILVEGLKNFKQKGWTTYRKVVDDNHEIYIHLANTNESVDIVDSLPIFAINENKEELLKGIDMIIDVADLNEEELSDFDEIPLYPYTLDI